MDMLSGPNNITGALCILSRIKQGRKSGKFAALAAATEAPLPFDVISNDTTVVPIGPVILWHGSTTSYDPCGDLLNFCGTLDMVNGMYVQDE